MSNPERPTMMNCAMNFGAVVGLYYIVKFCLFPLSLHSTMVALLFLGLTLVVPSLVFMLVKRYRDQYCQGRLEFVHAWAFSVLIMGFGSLLAAAAHYIYFAYIDGGTMVGVLMQSIEQLQGIDLSTLEGSDADALAQYEQSVEIMKQTAEQLQRMSAIEITMGMLSNNFSWSIVLSLPIALFVSMRKIKQKS
jgi:hypothetical protein